MTKVTQFSSGPASSEETYLRAILKHLESSFTDIIPESKIAETMRKELLMLDNLRSKSPPGEDTQDTEEMISSLRWDD